MKATRVVENSSHEALQQTVILACNNVYLPNSTIGPINDLAVGLWMNDLDLVPCDRLATERTYYQTETQDTSMCLWSTVVTRGIHYQIPPSH